MSGWLVAEAKERRLMRSLSVSRIREHRDGFELSGGRFRRLFSLPNDPMRWSRDQRQDEVGVRRRRTIPTRITAEHAAPS